MEDKEEEVHWLDKDEDGTEDPTCPDCGGEMTWCDCCRMWSQNGCVDYGACQCS